MTLPYTLYPGKAGSPITTLTAQYVAGTDSSVQVEDASVLPSASNRVTIMKTDRSAFVTVKYTTVSGNTLSGLTYEEGDLTTFPEGSIAVRNIANKDFSDVIGDINYLESAKVNVSQGAAESGKYLKVGADGNVTTGTAVSDYPDLTNKPSINSVTILGNQTSEQLNIVTNLTKAQYDALSAEEKMSGKIFFTTDEAGGGGGGGAVWGDITGTLSNQTDLEVALTGKQPVANAVSLSAPTAITIADNTDYTLTDVASLTFTYPASGSYQAFITMTTASSGTITIVFPTSMYVPKVPTFGNSETWLIGITNGIVIAQKAVSS